MTPLQQQKLGAHRLVFFTSQSRSRVSVLLVKLALTEVESCNLQYVIDFFMVGRASQASLSFLQSRLYPVISITFDMFMLAVCQEVR